MRQQSPSPWKHGVSSPIQSNRERKGSSGSMWGGNQRGLGPHGRLRPHHPRPRVLSSVQIHTRLGSWLQSGAAGGTAGSSPRQWPVCSTSRGFGGFYSLKDSGRDWNAGLGKRINVVPTCELWSLPQDVCSHALFGGKGE